MIPITATIQTMALILPGILLLHLPSQNVRHKQPDAADQAQTENENSDHPAGSPPGILLSELWDGQRRWRCKRWHTRLSGLNIKSCREGRVGRSCSLCGRWGRFHN